MVGRHLASSISTKTDPGCIEEFVSYHLGKKKERHTNDDKEINDLFVGILLTSKMNGVGDSVGGPIIKITWNFISDRSSAARSCLQEGIRWIINPGSGDCPLAVCKPKNLFFRIAGEFFLCEFCE